MQIFVGKSFPCSNCSGAHVLTPCKLHGRPLPCTESGNIKGAREWFDDIVASGRPADEFAFAGLANCFRNIPPVSLCFCSLRASALWLRTLCAFVFMHCPAGRAGDGCLKVPWMSMACHLRHTTLACGRAGSP